MMPNQQRSNPELDQAAPRGASTARSAGGLLLLTALLNGLSAISRLSADTDQASLPETLDAISLHSGLYGLGGAARLFSGLSLIAAAWFLLRTWIIRQRLGSPSVPVLFIVSGVFTGVSGLCAVVLAVASPEVSPLIEVAALFRWVSGKVGFAIAGLALIVASRLQWKAEGVLRSMAAVSAILGMAMQFIWIDSATMVHAVVGAVFFLWLIAVGGILVTDRTEKLFTRMLDSHR